MTQPFVRLMVGDHVMATVTGWNDTPVVGDTVSFEGQIITYVVTSRRYHVGAEGVRLDISMHPASVT